MLIVYCKTCGRRIAEAELASGKARQVDENEYECGCAEPAAAPAPVPIPVPSPTAARRPSTGSAPTQARPQRITKTIPTRKSAHVSDGARSAVDPKSKSNSMLLIIGGSIFVAVIGILVLATQSSSTPQPTAKAPTPAPEPTKTSATEPPVKTPEAAAPPAPKVAATPAAVEPVQPPRDSGNEMEEVRNDLAATKLREAREFASAHPDDPWTYKDKLDALVGTFRSTPAGKDAQTLLANLKVPEKPAPGAPAELPQGTGDWKVIIGPNNLDGINSQCRDAWIAVNGAVEKKPNTDNAAQSAAEFGDGEFRVRFEVANKPSNFFFCVHQGAEGVAEASFYKPQLDQLPGKHELVITCAGDQFKATLDGKALTLNLHGTPHKGRMQFNSHEGNVRIFSIEYRPLSKP